MPIALLRLYIMKPKAEVIGGHKNPKTLFPYLYVPIITATSKRLLPASQQLPAQHLCGHYPRQLPAASLVTNAIRLAAITDTVNNININFTEFTHLPK